MKNTNKTSPKISVIIPVYNTEEYLRQCLDSILNQTFKDIEIICIDDGSNDKSYSILKEYEKKDSRITIIKQKNNGAGSARNLGLCIAKGKYIIFLDSDDCFDLYMLEYLFTSAEENNADMTVCSAKMINEKGDIVENTNPIWPLNLYTVPFNKVFNYKDYPKEILDMFCVVPWNKLYLTAMLKNNSIKFQDLSSCNDISFGYISRICAERIIVTDKKSAFYRLKRKGGISETRADKAINVIKAFIEVKNFLLKKNLFKQLESTLISAFTNRLRGELSRCNNEQYEKFVLEMKSIMPDDWHLFDGALKKETATLEKLYKIIGDNKVFLWGASLFLKNLLKSETSPNPNILGIIDKNSALEGKVLGNYKIYSSEILHKTNADAVLMTVFSNNETVYSVLQKELKNDHPKIKLLENIFK